MRYRKPSLETALGLTSAKKQLKREIGIYNATNILNAPTNAKRTAKRALGWESAGAKFFRFVAGLFKAIR